MKGFTRICRTEDVVAVTTIQSQHCRPSEHSRTSHCIFAVRDEGFHPYLQKRRCSGSGHHTVSVLPPRRAGSSMVVVLRRLTSGAHSMLRTGCSVSTHVSG